MRRFSAKAATPGVVRVCDEYCTLPRDRPRASTWPLLSEVGFLMTKMHCTEPCGMLALQIIYG